MTSLGKGKARRMREWLARGPFAIAASALQGGMNYAIVLYLSFGSSMAATGQYRTLFSYYSLLALASMLESNKVYIRSVVTGDREAATSLFANRIAFSAGAAVLVAAGWGIAVALGVAEPEDWPLPAIAALSIPVYACDFYYAHLQAERRFQVLFLVESIKYLGALAVFLAVARYGQSLNAAVIAQLAFLGLCNAIYFAIFAKGWVRPGRSLTHFIARLTEPASRQARTLSVANMFPASLENVDKLLVGWVFGLSFLGVYTLAYSTGRFLYNILKPAMYVYYRRFVDEMPGWPLLKRVGAGFTILGLATSAVFLAGIVWVPEMHKFESGRWATVILFTAYGVGIVHAAYSQAFALNKDTDARHALWAHATATAGSLALLAAALLSPPEIALVLLAVQYPFRDGASVLLMEHFRRRRA